jgi:Flp pilus assembly pilin Flp
MRELRSPLWHHLGDESGQTMAEYGVVLTVITVAIVLVFASLSDAIKGTIDAIISVLS